MSQLKSSDVETRRTAVRALGKLTPLDERGVTALTTAVADGDVEVRRLSIAALRQAGPAAATSVSALERALEDQDLNIRVGAALAIKSIDPSNRRVQPVLIGAIRRGDGPTMLEVGRMGESAAWAVPSLQALLAHDSAKVRALAARTLGQIGAVGASAEAALKRSLRDPNVAVQDAAQAALGKIHALSLSPMAPR